MNPVVALDIDGTLGDYHGHFTRFAEAWIGRSLPPPDKNTEGVEFYKWLGMSRSTYNDCKLAYRQGGMKRSMPCYDDAADVVAYLRKHLKYEVWICTTRPYLRLDNVDPDTRHWLRRNKIQYDGLLYGSTKYRDLVRSVAHERVAMVVDDLPKYIKQAVRLGLPTAMRDQPYNRYFDHEPRIVWLTEIVDILEGK